MELKRKIDYSWAFTSWTSYCFKGYKNLPFAWDGVRYNKLSIAMGMTSTSNYFFFKKNLHLIRSRCIIDSIFLFLTTITFSINNFTIKSPHEINLERWLRLQVFYCSFILSNHPAAKLRTFIHIWKHYNKVRGIWFMA